MEFKHELGKSIPHSKNESLRTLLAVFLFIIWGLIESNIFPWGLGMKLMLPLAVTYSFLGMSLGTSVPTSLGNAAIHGAVIGVFTYGILGAWLQGIGAYHSLGIGFTKFLLGVMSVIFVSMGLKELSRIFKIEADETI